MNKVTFPKSRLLDEDLPYNAIEDKLIGTTRWAIQHRIVFELDGKHWEALYSVGATERQDEGPWEYEDEIQCVEVELKEIVVKKWLPVE
jgi:hypothetical protein